MAIQNLQPGTTYAIHMRSPSSSGGKDWVGSVTSSGEMHAFWGKTGQINQRQGKVGDMTKLQALISEKLKKGYTEVDNYDPNRGWQSQQQPAPSQPASPTPAPTAKPTGPPVNLLKVQVKTDTIQTPAAAVAPLAWDF